ncbi:hypothetical protein HMPREF9240_01591 [Winkia neuii BV029A5]|uniref:Uncharacterized protein n=1 Tax=Winkia neuii BV029A5 TaxID=888439 RepID=K0YZG8_9ACTO|nr:hypothetical protein HMPREF9240_01591 [Winkia neuii BV029A5]
MRLHASTFGILVAIVIFLTIEIRSFALAALYPLQPRDWAARRAKGAGSPSYFLDSPMHKGALGRIVLTLCARILLFLTVGTIMNETDNSLTRLDKGD